MRRNLTPNQNLARPAARTNTLKRLSVIIIQWFFIVVALGAAALLVAGQLGYLSGAAPRHLGVRDGRLKPPNSTPNSVSSQAALWPNEPMAAYATIEALQPQPGESAHLALARLKALLEQHPAAHIVEARPDYLNVQFTTRWLKFVDDAEFWVPPEGKTIEVRSSSRLGRKDFGTNRERIEALRARLNKP